MSGAQAATPTVMRPLRAPCHLACSASIRAMQRSPSVFVHVERSGIADAALGLVPRLLAQQQAKPGIGDGLRIGLDVAAVFQDRRGAAADRLQRGQPHHGVHLFLGQLGYGKRRQPAGEGRLVRRRQVLVDALGDDQREMGVDVGKPGHHHLAGAVHDLGAGEARDDLSRRTDGGDPAVLHRNGGVVMHAVAAVDRDHRRVVQDRGAVGHFPVPRFLMPARVSSTASHIPADAQPQRSDHGRRAKREAASQSGGRC